MKGLVGHVFGERMGEIRMSDLKPRRSMLFMPAANERALEKAKNLQCDGVIFDLEDAVAPEMKPAARERAVAAVRSGAYGYRELVIRVNGLDTEWWHEDVKAAAAAQPDAILVPKVESADDIEAVADLLEQAGADDTEIWAMLETPMAFLHAKEIAGVSEKLTCFVIGTNDLVKELRAHHTKDREPVITALGLAMLAARAYGQTILDSVYNNFRDMDGFRDECLQAVQMGFDGKALIHPNQLEAANETFAPSAADVEHAEQLIAAFREAKKQGKGVAVFEGKMVEDLHVAEAKRTLAIAGAIAAATARDH